MMGKQLQQVQHHHQEQRCIWIVGDRGTGKKRLAAALGAITTVATTGDQDECELPRFYDWKVAPTPVPVRVVVCEDAAQLQLHPQHDSDIHLLCFDLSDHASFAAISDDWCKFLHRSPCQAVLVGTNCECACSSSRTRQVTATQAMELALVECDEYVEVCSLCPSSEGVVYLRQLLATWLAQDSHASTDTLISLSPSSVPSSPPSPLPSPSKEKPRTRCGVRTSVWLYDPTDEVDGVDNLHHQRHTDVKLRPISRALFEMREASGDRSKSLERRREQSVHKLVTRSRYYGPTESSRSMRWQVHQQQQSQIKQSMAPAAKTTSSSSSSQRGRRQSTSDIDGYQADHAQLETKLFMQTTKLAKQRMGEMRSVRKGVEKPTSPKSSHKNGSRSRTRAMTTESRPSASVRPRTASSLSHYSPSASQQSRPVVFSLLDDDAASEFALNAMAPSVETTPVPARFPIPPVSSASTPSPAHGMWSDNSSESSDDDVQAVTPLPKPHSLVLPSPSPSLDPQDNFQDTFQDLDDDKEQSSNGFSSEIDDMLDYFDGISLPI